CFTPASEFFVAFPITMNRLSSLRLVSGSESGFRIGSGKPVSLLVSRTRGSEIDTLSDFFSLSAASCLNRCTLESPPVLIVAEFLAVGWFLGPPGRRVLEVLLPAVWGPVEQAVGVGEPFAAPGVGRIGMKDVVVDAEEDAQAV